MAGLEVNAALEGWLIAGLVIAVGAILETLRRAGRKQNGR